MAGNLWKYLRFCVSPRLVKAEELYVIEGANAKLIPEVEKAMRWLTSPDGDHIGTN